MKPFEQFLCGDCTHISEHWETNTDSHDVCSELQYAPRCRTDRACDNFNPKYSVLDRYRICVLEEKVAVLEAIMKGK